MALERPFDSQIWERDVADKIILDQINLIVGDMEKSLAFYRRLGLSIPEKAQSPEGHVGIFTENGFGLDFDSPGLLKSLESRMGGPPRFSRENGGEF